MKKLVASVAIALSCAYAGSVSALVLSQTGSTSGGNPGGQTLWQAAISTTDVGQSFNLGWDCPTCVADQVFGAASFTIVNFVDGNFQFSVDITNNSIVSGSSNPRIMSFGFNTNPNASVAVTDNSLTDTDAFSTTALIDVTFAGFQTIDVCLKTANNCAGGNINNGLASGNTDSMLFSLTGANIIADNGFILSDFAMKFQGINSYELAGQPVCRIDCGKTPPQNIPAPGTILLMGLGLLGLTRFARKSAAK